MSRWSEAFAALSEGHDTLDTMRHSERDICKVSRSVKSVRESERAQEHDVSAEAPIVAHGEFEERATVVEFGVRVPRAWSEGFARLNPDKPPADVPPHRWQVFVEDVGRFLHNGFAEQAAALGWTPFDLFGADPDRPFARIDMAGLLWLLNGARLVALTESTATLETAGVRQTFRRNSIGLSRALAWELL